MNKDVLSLMERLEGCLTDLQSIIRAEGKISEMEAEFETLMADIKPKPKIKRSVGRKPLHPIGDLRVGQSYSVDGENGPNVLSGASRRWKLMGREFVIKTRYLQGHPGIVIGGIIYRTG